MANLKSLQQAVNRTAGKDLAPKGAEASPPPAKPKGAAERQPTRIGQVNISAWLNPDFKAGLRLIQAQKGGNTPLQDLLSEALNDLFRKYNVPTVSDR